MLPACQRLAAARRGVELGDIFRAHGESYRHAHPLPVSHLKIMQAVERCRTAALGGHLEQCDSCGYERPAYNSCRNRHCPKCQSLAKAKWLDKQKSELLPVAYFHLVFTLPHELNALILTNKKILLSHLFKAMGETLVDFGRARLGGQIGVITVLRTLRLDPGETKNKEGRNFPFTIRLREIIERQLEHTKVLEKATGRNIPWLFHRNGKPIKTFRRSWLTGCVKAGFGRR